MATFQPPPSSPMMLSFGTRTSVKNTSPKSLAPLICFSGRISTPGAKLPSALRRSTSSIVMPRCFLASVLVRNRPNILSA